MKKRIGVVFGGRSVEHEISILSTIQVIKAIDRNKYDIVLIYLDKQNQFFVGPDFDKLETFQRDDFKKYQVMPIPLKNNQIKLKGIKCLLKKTYRLPIDCILSIVHGAGVEDGTLAGFFNILDVPYTGSDVLAASLSQDKVIMKKLFQSSNIPTIPFTYFTKHEWVFEQKKLLRKVNTLGFPVIIKPSRLGSSIGISIAKEEEELINGLNLAFEYDERVVVEKALVNYREFNCASFGKSPNEVISEIEEVVTKNDLLTFDDKYKDQEDIPKRIIPAEIDHVLSNKIKNLTSEITKLILNKGISRIDFLYCLDQNNLYVNEINTIPGSLAFYLFDPLDIDFKQLITNLIEQTIKDKHIQKSYRTSFETNILSVSKLFKK